MEPLPGESERRDSVEQEWTAHRPTVMAVAYRMLGSVSEAEDIAQEAFLRLHRTREKGETIENPAAFLVAVATRLAIDQLRSARGRREEYVGTWLPEPVVEGREAPVERQVRMAESLSMAFLVLLETLTPVERAVYLLREVFEYDYEDIAAIVQRSEANCRQIFARAKRHIDADKPRFDPLPAQREELARRFLAAARQGRVDELIDLLAADVTFYGDGGGKAVAVAQPLHGSDRVARFLAGLFTKGERLGAHVEPTFVNGQPGAIIFDRDHRVVFVMALEIAGGVIQAIRSVVNPDKLQHLGSVSDAARLPTKNRVREPGDSSRN